MMRRVTAVLAVPLLLAACGGGEDEPKAEPAPSASEAITSAAPTTEAPAADPADEVRTAVEAYSTAYLTGDGATAYQLLSKKCQQSMPLSTFATMTEQAKDLYGEVPIESFDARVKGERASVTYSYAVPSLTQTDESWVNEGGWKNNDC